MKSFRTWGPFLEALGNYRARYAILFFIPDGSLKSFENCTVKLSAKQAKLTSLEFRTHPTFLETLISTYDFVPVELPGLSRNGPLESHSKISKLMITDLFDSHIFRFHSVQDVSGVYTSLS